MYLRGAKWVPGLFGISQEPGKIQALCFMQNKFSLVKFWGESESKVLAASCKRSLGSRFIWRLIRLKSKKKKWVLVLDFPCLSGLSSSEPWRAQGPCQGLLAREKEEENSSLPRQGLGRGVRSDAQLSSTETRFQKCYQSGKNGSNHPMLSISMAFNVISCKKVKRNTQKLKIADFTM